jgi:tail tube GTA-gp10-like protein
MIMANAARGDSELVAGGQSLVMRLTLGALSEIEDGLGAGGGLAGIAGGLKSLASKDIALVASALLKGGGYDISPAEVMHLETDVGTLVGAITGAFQGASKGQGVSKETAATPPAQVPLAAASTGAPSSNSASA